MHPTHHTYVTAKFYAKSAIQPLISSLNVNFVKQYWPDQALRNRHSNYQIGQIGPNLTKSE